jgi:flagellin-like protein
MNFEKVLRKNRKAISPVLATVILIAITLIAAIAVAGFVFGLFGTFTSTAQVQASVTSCVASGSGATAQETCSLVLTNSGNANTLITGVCSLTFGGSTYTATASATGTSTTTVPSGGSGTYQCQDAAGTGHSAGAGSQVTGAVILSNGGNALFSGTGS